MRARRFLTTMTAGFLGAAVLLVAANALGFVGGGQTEAGAVQGAYASFKGAGLTPQQLYERHAGSVVEIRATFPGTYDIFGQQTGGGQALGTGFVVSSDGYILTNAHVVSQSGQAVGTVTVTFKGDGSQGAQVEGTVLGADESTDVAVIKVDPGQTPDLKAIPLGDSSKVTVGEQVVAIDNPLGLDFSLSSGVVSATDRQLQSPNGATIDGGIQTDAAINSGNSGGPLIDASGRVIGINEQIASQGGGNEGIGFAVPINTAVQVMEQIKAGTLPQQSQTVDPYGDGSTIGPY